MQASSSGNYIAKEALKNSFVQQSRKIEEIQLETYSKILILALFGFTGSLANADESIPIEATIAAEAQQVAQDYGDQKDQKSELSDE